MRKLVFALIVLIALFLFFGCTESNSDLNSLKDSSDKNSMLVGGDKDSHGCIGSAGYQWCEEKQKCLRVWEEECTELGDTVVYDENGLVSDKNADALNEAALNAQKGIILEFSKEYADRIDSYLKDSNQLKNALENEYVDKNLTFEQLKAEFKSQIFFTQPDEVISQSALESIVNVLYQSLLVTNSGKYSYSLQDSSEQKAAFTNALKEAFEKQATEKDWLDVRCSETNCADGTFYMIIPFNLINDSVFLPKLAATDNISKDMAEVNIVPKEEVSIHMTSAIFKEIIDSKQ